jgi:hypothetical protein
MQESSWLQPTESHVGGRHCYGGERIEQQMWGTIVDRDGIVCAVAFTGVNRGAQMAGKPGYLSAEGDRGECVQPAFVVE